MLTRAPTTALAVLQTQADLARLSMVAAWLMLGFFCLVLSIGLFFVYLVRRQARATPAREPSEDLTGPCLELRGQPWPGLPQRWLAIRTARVGSVQAALGLANPQPCAWTEVLDALADNHLVLLRPIRGWVLVLGPGLRALEDDVDCCFRWVTRLSRRLGRVQYFSANTVFNHHAWVNAHNGRVRRAYVWAGETLWNQGPKTIAERELGLVCWDYGETPVDYRFWSLDAKTLNAEKVHRLAARWGFDPASLDDCAGPPRQGILGELLGPKTH